MIRVGVVRGGFAPYQPVSIRSGAFAMNALRERNMQPIDIFVDEEGLWHMRGKAVDGEKIRRNIDVAVNALAGPYGEDGGLARDLEMLGIPYVGSSPFISSRTYDKRAIKEDIGKLGFNTPKDILVKGRGHGDYAMPIEAYAEWQAESVFRRMSGPWVVKPTRGSSSYGVFIAKNYPELKNALAILGEEGDDILVEEFIDGKHVAGAVIEGLRGEPAYALLPHEVSTGSGFFDFESRAIGAYETRILRDTNGTGYVEKICRNIFKALGIRHIALMDMIVSQKGIYVSEIDTVPEWHEEALLHRLLASTGITAGECLEHLIRTALSKR